VAAPSHTPELESPGNRRSRRTTQETAIRIMSRWNKDHIVFTEDLFRIPDPKKLEEIPPGE
jgi:hypothetical protein